MWQLGRWLSFGSILMILLAFAPGAVLGQKKKGGGAKDPGFPAAPEDYAKIKNVKELAGTLVSVNSASKSLTIRIEIPRVEPNPNYKPPAAPKIGTKVDPSTAYQMQMMKHFQELQKLQQQAAVAKTPQERQKLQMRYQTEMTKWQQQQAQYMAKMNAAAGKGVKPGAELNPNNQPFRTVYTKIDYELGVEDEVVTRKMFLPFEYDDTGNVKQYTDKEKEELKGKDKTKPGYTARIDEAIPSQEIRVFLTPPKAKKQEKGKDKEADPGAFGFVDTSNRPTVNMLILVKEGPAIGIIEGAGPKKEKKKK